mgnify:CR=1
MVIHDFITLAYWFLLLLDKRTICISHQYQICKIMFKYYKFSSIYITSKERKVFGIVSFIKSIPTVFIAHFFKTPRYFIFPFKLP